MIALLQRVAEALNDQGKALKGAKILVLGAAYKKDVDDPRESPGLKIITLLQNKGAAVTYNDPHLPRLRGGRKFPDLNLTSVELTPENLSTTFDLPLVVEKHGERWLARAA